MAVQGNHNPGNTDKSHSKETSCSKTLSESGFTSKQRKKVTDEKSTERGEAKEGENRKVREIEAVLLLCLTSTLQPVWHGWP